MCNVICVCVDILIVKNTYIINDLHTFMNKTRVNILTRTLDTKSQEQMTCKLGIFQAMISKLNQPSGQADSISVDSIFITAKKNIYSANTQSSSSLAMDKGRSCSEGKRKSSRD